MSDQKKIAPGTVFFRFLPGSEEPNLIRLVKIQNSDCFVVMSKGIKIKMNAAEFSLYTKLNPDAQICFSILELEDKAPDVLVSIYRKEDAETDGLPFCICRQNLYDTFTNTVSPSEDGRFYIGCSIAKDTCPSDINYKMLMACNGVTKMDIVSAYYDDSLETILSFINTMEYDQVIEMLDRGYDHDQVITNTKSLKDLLVYSHFMDDFWRGLRVVKAPFEFVPEMTTNLLHWVQDIIKHEMLSPVVVRFTREIDLNAIQDKYVLLLDTNNDLFVISYKEGEYINRPYAEMGDDTEVRALEKAAGKRYEKFHVVK